MSKRSSRQSLRSGKANSSPKNSPQPPHPQVQRQVAQERLIPPLFEVAQDAIVLVDGQGCFVDANQAACQLFGQSRQLLIGKALSTFLGARFDCGTAFTTASSEPAIAELCSIAPNLLDPNKARREVEYTLTLNALGDCHLMLLRDISQRQEALEAELRRQRQRVELFSEVTLKIRQSLQLKEILHTTVTEVQRILQADRVLIYQVLPDGTGKTISESGLPNYPVLMDLEFPEEVFPLNYQALYAQGRVRAIADVHDPKAGLAECLVEFVDQFDIKAKLIVPIVQSITTHPTDAAQGQNQLWGLLIAHQCKSPRHWVDFELELMQQLADQISIALSQAQLLEHLEEIVETRTAELKEANRHLQQEVNDRIQAETALRQSEEQLRLITNALPVLIAYVDAQQRYRFNNQAYEEWFGKTPNEIHGDHLRQVWGQDCYERMQTYVEAALSGQVISYENDIILKNNRMRSVDVTYIPDVEGSNTVKGFFALTSDISDRKAIERMKDEFISVVSHELRTPLTSLHSALKILATGRLGNLSNEGQQMLGIADDSTERLVRLVNNVLDLQRIESGKVIMHRQACNAASLMTSAVEAMQAMAQQHEITLVSQPADLEVWADADYILQALTNLLSNAIKFSSPGGTVWLTIEPPQRQSQPIPQGSKSKSQSLKSNAQTAKLASKAARSATQNSKLRTPQSTIHNPPSFPEVVFRVRDEGQGIPAHELERIFERFQQVDSSDSRKKGGTGLGLTICRKIIEQHHGRIWAESKPGYGSVFSFTLPTLMEAESL